MSENENRNAYIVGLIAGLVGIYGLAHMLNGQFGTGFLWLILGGVINFIFASIAIATLGLALLVLIPAHIVIVHKVAKSGAKIQSEGS